MAFFEHQNGCDRLFNCVSSSLFLLLILWVIPPLSRRCIKPRRGFCVEVQTHVVAHAHGGVGGHAHAHIARSGGEHHIGVRAGGFDDGDFTAPRGIVLQAQVFGPQAQLQG